MLQISGITNTGQSYSKTEVSLSARDFAHFLKIGLTAVLVKDEYNSIELRKGQIVIFVSMDDSFTSVKSIIDKINNTMVSDGNSKATYDNAPFLNPLYPRLITISLIAISIILFFIGSSILNRSESVIQQIYGAMHFAAGLALLSVNVIIHQLVMLRIELSSRLPK
jgi:hypothetical protein